MREDLLVPDESDEKIDPSYKKSLVWEQFTPLEERIAKENPALLEGLQNLKNTIGEADFDRYINSLLSLKKNDTTVLLITAKELHRTIIEGKFVKAIKDAFGVQSVRTICQASGYFF